MFLPVDRITKVKKKKKGFWLPSQKSVAASDQLRLKTNCVENAEEEERRQSRQALDTDQRSNTHGHEPSKGNKQIPSCRPEFQVKWIEKPCSVDVFPWCSADVLHLLPLISSVLCDKAWIDSTR